MRKLSSLILQGSLAHHRTSKFNPRYVSVRLYCNTNDSDTPSFSKRPGPLTQYKTLVEQGKLKHDSYQEEVSCKLDNLLDKLEEYERDMEEYHEKLNKWEQTRENERRSLLMAEAEVKQQGGGSEPGVKKQNAVQKWFSRNTDQISAMLKKKKLENMESGVGKWVSYLNRERKLDNLVGRRPTAPAAPKGLYLYGNVGSGKTMLMDLFYNSTEGFVKHRRRFHFHEAMLDINERMHRIWKSQVKEKSSQSGISSWIANLPFDTKIKEWLAAEESFKQEMQLKNILPAVADKFLVESNGHRAGASILCFDEIQTVDVFAIVALSGILSRLLSTGTILVATSNRAPWELNQDGMQKEIFQKLVQKLDEQCDNVFIGSEIDYRRQIAKRPVDEDLYFWPLESAKAKEFENVWEKLIHGKIVTSTTIKVMFGRTLEVPQCCNGIARFRFEYLCGRPLGAADYIAVARNFHTVFISDIPVMSMQIRDKARRFITLVDELYNHHCCVYCSAAASIDELFQGTEEGTLFDLESFQFETEMEDSKLRQDVLSPGTVSSGGSPTGIISMLSGQEEMFAFRRAVSRLIEMQTSVYLEGTATLHPYFQHQN